jgi:hypothetical protein
VGKDTNCEQSPGALFVTTFGGQLVICGPTVSTTVTNCVQTELLAEASIAVHLRRMTPVALQLVNPVRSSA